MKKNYLYNLLLTVFNLLIPVVSFPYVSRILGPAGVGKVQFVTTLGQYIALLSALGIPLYGVREIARVRHEPAALARTFRELFAINGLVCLLSTAGYLAAVCTQPYFSGSRDFFAPAAAVVLLGFTSLEWLFSGLEAFRLLALRSIVVKGLSVLLILLLVRGAADTKIYLYISLGAICANNLVNLTAALRYLRGPAGPLQYRRHWKPLLFIFGTTLASTLYTTFDSILLGFLAGDTAVGFYTAATKITKISLPVIMAYGGVLVPEITRAFAAGDAEALRLHLNRSFAYIVLLAVPIAAGLTVFAPALMLLFSGPQFLTAVGTMRIMAGLPLLVGLGYFWGYQVIMPQGGDRLLLMSAAIGMGLSLALNFLLIPRLRQDGAAIAAIAAEAAVTLAYFLLIRRRLRAAPRTGMLGESVLSCLPFAAFLVLPGTYVAGSTALTLLVNIAACALLYGSAQVFVFRNEFLVGFVNRYSPVQLKARRPLSPNRSSTLP